MRCWICILVFTYVITIVIGLLYFIGGFLSLFFQTWMLNLIWKPQNHDVLTKDDHTVIPVNLPVNPPEFHLDELVFDADISLLTKVGNFCFLYGSLVIITSITGIVGTKEKRRNGRPAIHFVTFVGIGLSMAIDFGVLWVHQDLGSIVHQHLIAELKEQLVNYEFDEKAEHHFTFELNALMLMKNCCGIMGPSDFADKTTEVSYYKNGSTVKFLTRFPPACCKAEFVTIGYESLIECSMANDIKNIDDTGCYESMFDVAFLVNGDRAGYVLVLKSVAVSTVQIVQLALLLFIIRAYKKRKLASIQLILNNNRQRHDKRAPVGELPTDGKNKFETYMTKRRESRDEENRVSTYTANGSIGKPIKVPITLGTSSRRQGLRRGKSKKKTTA